MQHESQAGTLVDPSRVKAGDYFTYWFSIHEPTIRGTSASIYAGYINNRIIPTLGHIPLQKLTIDHLQSFYSSLINEGVKPKSVKDIHMIVNAALGQAVEWGKLGRNPASKAKLPRESKKEMQVFNKEQIQALLTFVEGHKLECIVTLALATGMRQGELLALRWSDIDLERKMVQVQRTLTYIPGQGLKESETKTDSGRRSIVLADHAIAVIKKHRAAQLEQRHMAGNKWREHGLVFCSIYGTHTWSANVRHAFVRLLHDAELPIIRFHDLRHSCATALLCMGVHPKVVQEILGHSSVAITMNIYSHVLPSIQQEAMASMNAFMTGKQGVI